MMKYHYKATLTLLFFLTFSMLTTHAKAQDAQSKIIAAMKASENDWNKGDLDSFMKMYTDESTMMMSTGPAGINTIRELYEKKYFNGKMPKQNLHYDDLKVTLLGEKYALLTGKFTFSGSNLPERSGRYSLVMILTKNGWKILHDHSS